ncbi:hypothetical protein [Lichenifustis flavocetrariae]|uniref:Uncharacterized protein n=1 Tax=Lichenifustis flavocetrariae TaxID=2949735 RepID=A0AA41Z4H6_9HYPH|nr:hypothetical protein [Lichenifustis flavocetrariae]MCW6512851.1 hypothetical protein [Lichenifustis flavocetrariae]
MAFTAELCQTFAPIIQDATTFEEVPVGWHRLVEDLMARLVTTLAGEPGIRLIVRQIKEKFGGLRFYYRLAPEIDRENPTAKAIRALVDEAESKSLHTCDTCGSAGLLREGSGWYATRCDEHADRDMQPA